MLNNLSEQIRECLQHAEDCARQAAAQTDQKLKQNFLDKERRWLMLAQSYDFTHRTQFVAQKIIELAKRGLENPTELHLAAIKEFNSETQEPTKPAQPSI